MSSPYTTLGLPPDGVAWGALGLAFVLLPALHFARSRAPAPRALPWLLAGAAALLSAGYVAYYLRGGPRIVDATSYYLQARAMAHGFFAFPVPEPLGSFGGRFLLPGAGRELSVIFPPGYAAVLSLGFLAGAPLAVGPVLGAAIAGVTYALGKQLSGQREVGLIAVAFSVLCAALRYHTADTMSHGLCALLLSVAALCAIRGRSRDALCCGLACGWLIATRPVSGGVALLLSLALLGPRPAHWLRLGVGLLPGIALLLCYQHSATGSFFGSTQLAYYRIADGPPGCFRYGFGAGIGCLFEHGDYVRARLPHGYGLAEAAGVTLRRLAVHSIDIANAAPLALLCPWGAWLWRRDRRVRLIFAGCLGLMLAYAPFYFDGSYPGGGTRLFADLLPLEHVLLALALFELKWARFALPVSLLGFACHASFAHRSLAEREGGRPMFEARTLAAAGVTHGLVLVDTDHGFNLGHEPGESNANEHVVVARHTHDAHDLELWNRLGRPPAYRYLYSAAATGGRVQIAPYSPASSGRFEAEAEWPPIAVAGGWAHPDFHPCASGGRALRLRGASSLTFELGSGSPASNSRGIRLGWIREPGPATRLELGSAGGASASTQVPSGPEGCIEIELPALRLSGRATLSASRPGALDYYELVP